VAAFVPQGAVVADVGTDHGFVPVCLTQAGRVKAAYACDIRPGPLNRARETAAQAGLEQAIRFRLTDGLDGLEGEPIDTVILAGMGGETMANILARALWLRERQALLILQPQSKMDELEAFLRTSGWAVTDAALVFEDGHYYPVFCARPGTWTKGVLETLLEKRNPLLPEYLDWLISRQERKIKGLSQAGRREEAALAEAEEALRGLMKMKEETNTWSR